MRVYLDPRIAYRLQPLTRILLETSLKQRARRGSAGRAAGRSSPGSSLTTAASRPGTGFAAERRPAGEHLEQHASEGPDVGALVDRLASGLLRRHVGRGTQYACRHGSPRTEIVGS